MSPFIRMWFAEGFRNIFLQCTISISTNKGYNNTFNHSRTHTQTHTNHKCITIHAKASASSVYPAFTFHLRGHKSIRASQQEAG